MTKEYAATIDKATIRDAERFRFLQNLPVVQAQAYFWNYSSRKQRAAAIDEDMNESGVAQLVEQRAVTAPGAGSTPAPGATEANAVIDRAKDR